MVEAEVKYFPVHHKRVFIFFSKKISTLAFVSGDTMTEALARLLKDNLGWNYSRHCLAIIDSQLLETAGMLDSSDISNERKFLHGKS